MAFKETKRKGFNFFRSYFDVFNELETDKDKIAFITALLDRQFLGVKPEGLKGMAKFAWISQVNSIDSQVKGYEDKTGVKLTPWQGGVEPPSEQVQVEVQEEVKNKEQGKELKIPFSHFWDLYDKKIGDKSKIKKKWEALKIETQKEILEYIPKYKESQPDKKYRKNPETFFNNKSWNDEIIETNNRTKETSLGTHRVGTDFSEPL